MVSDKNLNGMFPKDVYILAFDTIKLQGKFRYSKTYKYALKRQYYLVVVQNFKVQVKNTNIWQTGCDCSAKQST